MRDFLRIVPTLFQQAADRGEPAGDLARDHGRPPRGVERLRIEPDGAQPVADHRIAQIFQVDAKAAAVWELAIVATMSGEIGEQLQAMADVADDQKRRPAVLRIERPGIALGLVAGVAHQHVPAPAGTPAAKHVRFGGRGRAGRQGDLLALPGPAALLGLEDEAAALVEVDPADLAVAVQVAAADGALEHIVVGLAARPGGIGVRQVEQVGQLDEEHRIVGALGPAFAAAPPRNERVDARRVVPLTHGSGLRPAGVRRVVGYVRNGDLGRRQCHRPMVTPTGIEPVFQP